LEKNYISIGFVDEDENEFYCEDEDVMMKLPSITSCCHL